MLKVKHGHEFKKKINEELRRKKRKELLEIAKEMKIKYRHKMRKIELIEAIEKELINLSLEEDNFSSHILWEKEEIKEEKDIISNFPEEYKIPDRYNVDKIVLLPIDPHKHFTYWFLKDETLNKLKENYGDFKFLIKLYKEGIETLSFEVYSENGNYYIHHYAPFKKLFVVFGILKEGKFIPLMKSNKIVTPSGIIFYEGKEIWLKKEKGKKIIKKVKFKGSLAEEMKKLIKKFKITYCRREKK